jgi:BirA family biotin operon repressor/biotin-[acetyl-CoA-carboxylase] ligase
VSELRLAPEAEAVGYGLRTLGVTESTNDDALRLARAGEPGPLWIVADEQRAGRGRHGRAWASPPGNLYASLLLIDPCPLALAPQLGFLAGLALHEAIEATAGAGAPRLGLKWPNDLLLDGAKVAGLLLEGHRVGAALAVVIGFGVNVAYAPADTPYPAAPLRTVAPALTRGALFQDLSGAFGKLFAAWQGARHLGGPDPFAAIRRLWLERAAGLGKEVGVRLPSGDRRGIFEGLDGSGRLQLKTPAGLELIDAGDLFFPHLNPTTADLQAGTRY